MNEDEPLDVMLSGCTLDGVAVWQIAEFSTNGLPSVEGNGTTAALRYSPASDLSGDETFVVDIEDSRGRVGQMRAFVTISPLNDPPTFDLSASTLTVLPGASFSQLFATNLSLGPTNEVGQSLLGFFVSNSAPALFSTAPSCDNAGVLSFVAGTQTGVVQAFITAQDDGGLPGQDVSDARSFTIRIAEAGTTTGSTGSTTSSGSTAGASSAGSTTSSGSTAGSSSSGSSTGGITGSTGGTTGSTTAGSGSGTGGEALVVLPWDVQITRPKTGKAVRFKTKGIGTVRGVIANTGLPKKSKAVLVELAIVDSASNEPLFEAATKVGKVNRKGSAKFSVTKVGADLDGEGETNLVIAVRASTNFGLATTSTNVLSVPLK